jgi:two-component system, NarL family, response regulator NreC
MTTIVLADDHPIVRQGMRGLLETEPGFVVVGEAGDGREAVESVERLQPDVAILDLMMPELNGLEVARRALRLSPRTRVVILSMYSDEPHVLEALRAGAMAYVLKGTSTETLIFALREAMAGRRYLSPPLSDRAVEVYLAQIGTAARPTDRYELLTAREREVLELVARGASYAEIADKLTISPRTAETHRTNLMRKLDLRTSADITLYAVQRGLIDPEQG